MIEHLDNNQLNEFFGIKGTGFESRVSPNFLNELRIGYELRDLQPEKVIHELKCMEGMGTSCTISEAPFTDEPLLQGFWKKHYFQSRFIPRNCLHEVGPKLNATLTDLSQTCETHEAFANQSSYLVSWGAYKEKVRKRTLRGEWIVFGKHKGKRYYLTLALHEDPPVEIYERIKAACCNGFEFLLKS